MMHQVSFIIAAISLLSTGCAASQRVVSEPSKITLESAMQSVGQGLKLMYEAEGGLQTGLLPSQVTVTFNVSASGTDSGKLYVDLNPAVVTHVSKTGAEVGSTSTASRGNQITVTFHNILLTDTNKLLTLRSSTEIDELLKTIKRHIVLAE